MIVCLIYFVLLCAAAILSRILSPGPWRKAMRILAIVLLAPLSLGVVAILLLVVFFWWTAPPTLAHLQKTFSAQRHDLEVLLAMSDHDSRFSRIDPKFLDQLNPDGTFQGRFEEGDPKAALPGERWHEYREIFKRNHIDQGIERDSAGDAFFRFGAQGLLDRGYATGIAFCQTTPFRGAAEFRYEPCTSGTADGSGPEIEAPHREHYRFHQLASGWFAYEQGPG